MGRGGTGPGGGREAPRKPRAAVHRHSLGRLNAINDSSKKKTI